ncbi:MAG: ABC transporter permease [Burkholderiales bacterium]|nr:ABC transporter permease [Burkholderiales bacterium]MDE2394511.1 ABC transporter permease [Burkholderiales bacterium]MDE2454052.1 ABC transporter permease [Burkholderiales bacterium]
MSAPGAPSSGGRLRTVAYHLVAIACFLGLWEIAADRGWISQAFFGRPSGIAMFLWKGFVVGRKLWLELGYTIVGTVISFVLGSVSALIIGLVFASFPKLESATEPYLMVLNAMPRFALAPLFLLWFGLGLGSKIAVGVSLSFFIVLASTVAGIRGASQDLIILSRSLGASPRKVFFKITLPSAVPVIFSGLRLALIYSMLGVVGAEIIAAEHGLGQTLALLQSNFDMDGVMGLLFLLAMLGTIVTQGMSWLERKLLRWQ